MHLQTISEIVEYKCDDADAAADDDLALQRELLHLILPPSTC